MQQMVLLLNKLLILIQVIVVNMVIIIGLLLLVILLLKLGIIILILILIMVVGVEVEVVVGVVRLLIILRILILCKIFIVLGLNLPLIISSQQMFWVMFQKVLQIVIIHIPVLVDQVVVYILVLIREIQHISLQQVMIVIYTCSMLQVEQIKYNQS